MIAGYPIELLVVAVFSGIVGMIALDRLERLPLFVVGGLLVTGGLIPILQGTVASVATGGAARGVLTGPQVALGQVATLLGYAVVATGLLRPYRPIVGGSLLAGAMAFALGMFASAAVHTGQLMTVDRASWLLTLLAIVSARSLDPAGVTRLVKFMILGLLAASALAAASGVEWAWRPFEGASPLLPVLDVRLQGVFSHPNNLGPASLLYLLAERIRPSGPPLRIAGLSLGVGCLLLSQSKTALLTAVLVWGLFAYEARVRPRMQEFRVVPFALVVVVALGSMLFVGVTDGAEEELVDPAQIDRVRNFTGRTDVWTVGLDAWRERPVWGAGPDWFEAFARRTNQTWAGQAHNQFVQTGTQFGVVGIVGLVLYIAALVAWAWRLREPSRFASIGIVTVLLLRTITETPLDELDLLHLWTLLLLFGWARGQTDDDPLVSPVEEVRPRGAAVW